MPQTLEQERLHTSTVAPPPPRASIARRSTARKRLAVIAIIVLLLSAVVVWRVLGQTAASPIETAVVKRGHIAQTISATGRVQALTTVQVGTQVSGTISELYVDFNSQVKKGQVIARLDPSQLQAQLTQMTANLTGARASVQTAQSALLSAEAGVQAAEANVERAQSVQDDAQRNLERTRGLVDAGVTARRELDTVQAAVAQAAAQKQQAAAQLNQSRAQAQSARSQVNQAQAQAAQAGAAVQLASVNLEHTVIRAPIDGIIVSRSVDVGQTVAASLQAPTLFLIANDLTRMQVLADIDEADVGQLQPGAPVRFSVDAYPSETFEGKISQVRLAPQTVQNVVTYTAVIDVANPEMKLKPGMTANVTATIAERKDVLVVPNSALRYRPDDAPVQRGAGPVLWRANGQDSEPVRIQRGLSDGVSTEIVSGDLREGDRVIIGAKTNSANRPQRPAGGIVSPMGGSRGGGRIR